jgi:hypothetical protein
MNPVAFEVQVLRQPGTAANVTGLRKALLLPDPD